MDTYRITVLDDILDQELTGEFEAKNRAEAIKFCRDEYAFELDTIPSAIKIIKIVKI